MSHACRQSLRFLSFVALLFSTLNVLEGADLVPGELSASKTQGGPGETFTVTFTVRNIDTTDAKRATQAKVFAAALDQVDKSGRPFSPKDASGVPLVKARYSAAKAIIDVPPIAAGSSVRVSAEVALPPYTPEKHGYWHTSNVLPSSLTLKWGIAVEVDTGDNSYSGRKFPGHPEQLNDCCATAPFKVLFPPLEDF